MATLRQLEIALRNADAAGEMNDARKLAALLVKARQNEANMASIPGMVMPDDQLAETIPKAPETTIGQQLAGGLETAATIVPNMVGGTVGMIGGTLKGLAEQILSGQFGTPEAAQAVSQSAAQGAQALTIAPRTKVGGAIAERIGEIASQTIPFAPLTAEMSMLGAGAKTAASAAATRAAPAIEQAAAKAGEMVTKAGEMIKREGPGDIPFGDVPGAPKSGGAAGVLPAEQRAARAAEIGFTDDSALTRGQLTGTLEDKRFEHEMAKDAEIGLPVRERFSNQLDKADKVIDDFFDQTKAKARALQDIGTSVTGVLEKQLEEAKTKANVLYAKAEAAGEYKSPVQLNDVIGWMNRQAKGVPETAAIDSARVFAQHTGVAKVGPDGNLIAQPVTLREGELFRRAVGDTAGHDPVNIRNATIMKAIYDQETEPAGGKFFKQGRAVVAKSKRDFEQNAVIKQLLANKRGTEDRAVALEHVLNYSILRPSTQLDQMARLRRRLKAGGEEGKQAWQDLQGGVVEHIKQQAQKGVTKDEFGRKTINARALHTVIDDLDKSGKLEGVFGKKGAEMWRILDETAQDILTVPPGTVNNSGTASVLAWMADIGMFAASGIPAPILTSARLAAKQIANARLKAKVQAALAGMEKRQPKDF